MPVLHPMIVHFPIALFIVAVLMDYLDAFTKRRSFHAAVRLMMVLSVLGTGAALLTGDMLKDARSRFLPHELIRIHEYLAFAFAIWLLILTAARLHKRFQFNIRYLIMTLVGVALLFVVGHTGGMMAWPSIPTVHSPVASTTVATKRTPEDTSQTSTVHQSASHTQPQKVVPRGKTANRQDAGNPHTGGSTHHVASSGHVVTEPSTGHTFTPSNHMTTTSSPDQIQYVAGYNAFVADCQSCHSLNVVTSYYGSPPSVWESIVSRMQNYAGGAISDRAAQNIEYYLEHHR